MDNQSQTPPKRRSYIGMSSFEKGIFTESLIFHIPHSSVHIPFTTGFEVSLIQSQINLLTDVGTDLIFDVPNTERLVTPFSRVFCDVERLPDDLRRGIAKGRFDGRVGKNDPALLVDRDHDLSRGLDEKPILLLASE